MGEFFKPEDFKEVTGNWTREELANFCNLKIVSQFESNDYKPQENEIQLWTLVDSWGRIYKTADNEKLIESYLKDSPYDKLYVVKLTGYMPERE